MRTGSLILHPSDFILSLADGTRLALRAGDGDAARVVSFFARVARLAPASAPLPSGVRRLLAVTDAERNAIPPHTADVVCALEPPGTLRPRRPRLTKRGLLVPIPEPLTEEQWFWRQLARLSACIARETQPRGGVLLQQRAGASPLSQGERGRG